MTWNRSNRLIIMMLTMMTAIVAIIGPMGLSVKTEERRNDKHRQGCQSVSDQKTIGHFAPPESRGSPDG